MPVINNKIIINNNISKNKVGICLKNSCIKNEIFQNNFLNNSKNAYDECNNIWIDSKYGNFWSDYEEKYPDAKKKPLKLGPYSLYKQQRMTNLWKQ